MRKKFRFILILFKLKLSHMMVFRLSFFGAFFIDGTLFLVQLLTFSAIYANAQSIGDWSKGEMIVFIGTFSLINALNMVIFFFGINDIPGKIKDGGLDHYLTKPINSLFRMTFENISVGSIPLIFASIAIIIYGVVQIGVTITLTSIIVYILWIILMTVLWYDMELIIRTVPFFVISANSITRFEGAFLDFCMKIPGTLFKGAFKVLFYLIIPYGIMSTIPTQFIAGKLTPVGFVYGVLIVVIFTVFTLWFWRFGLKHYKSASS